MKSLGVLDNDLGKIWQPTQTHVSIKQLREWFAQFPYLSKLRKPHVLAQAITAALARADTKYAVAEGFDQVKNVYVGLKPLSRLLEIDFNSDELLVRRDVAEAQITAESPQATPSSDGHRPSYVAPKAATQHDQVGEAVNRALPRRFFAKITLDPNRPTPQVSNIAQAILSELDRAHRTHITLTLDIDAETADGFSDDIQSVIRGNAADLKITDFGFEGD